MRKSLYKKFYITFLSVVLVGFLLLGSIVLAFSGNYWLGRNQQLLTSQAQTIAGQIESASFLYSGGRLNQYAFQIASVICNAGDCQVLVVNSAGQPIARVGRVIGEQNVDETFVTPYLAKEGTMIGTLGDVLQEECIVAAVPIAVGGSAKGVVYALTPTATAGGYMADLLQILLVSALVTGALMVLSAYFVASAMVKPLAQMSQAAKQLAQGDFTTRIQVNRQDEIGKLAQSFNAMILSLEAGEKMRKGFVANVSHELKTPMTTISGFVDGMLDGTIPAHEQKKYLQIVSDEIKRLSRLVNTMLNLSKLESGEIALHPVSVDLSEMLCHTAFVFEQPIESKKITLEGLETLPDLTLTADRDLLHQVIYNLMENAVKYTPQEGCIRVGGWCEEGKVHVTIYNSGDGIDQADLPFLFDRFYKVDQSRGADKNSLGLGLYLVKTIVSLHGGQITVRSAKGSFCQFELEFNRSM